MNPQSIATESRALPAIFWAGLTCGVMDISAAFVTWWPQGVAPSRLLKGIAGGLLGPRAYDGGWPIAALGLACHFFIAFSAATVFYLFSRQTGPAVPADGTVAQAEASPSAPTSPLQTAV